MSWAIILTMMACSKAPEQRAEHKDHSGHNSSEAEVSSYYTCSMHPQIKEKKPGKCPICHMNLTKIEVENDVDDLMENSAANKIVKDTGLWQCENFPDVTSEVSETCPIDGTPMIQMKSESKIISIIAAVKLRKAQLKHFVPDFFPVAKMKMVKKIRLLGSVYQSEEKESSIPARIAGRVEKVYVKSTGSFVRLGDPIVDIYSPKLITAGEEFLLAKKSYKKNKTNIFKDMLNQSKERLIQWGIKPKQFEKWAKNKKVPTKITIYSPSTGIVRKRNAIVGKYFKEGQNFFELSDLSDIWVEMDVYEHDAALVKLGQEVQLEFTSLPGDLETGTIDFVSPVLDGHSRTLKIRTTIQNTTGKLKPGMIANATLNIKIDGTPLVIPRNAIIDTGKRKVTWVKISGRKFQAKVIRTGYESDGYVEVKYGLSEGEEVVIEGNFLLDAQAQLFGGYEGPATNSAHNH